MKKFFNWVNFILLLVFFVLAIIAVSDALVPFVVCMDQGRVLGLLIFSIFGLIYELNYFSKLIK